MRPLRAVGVGMGRRQTVKEQTHKQYQTIADPDTPAEDRRGSEKGSEGALGLQVWENLPKDETSELRLGRPDEQCLWERSRGQGASGPCRA